ncbi:antitoxin Xre/MbcA/ParS toxin-binding domain-containing protein [Noviherbaspirillum pedocola]|uniref:DUF2384 domain-containing protein n=1 Tax=Noviherbaspirillum pedocola TaxID=2801341 RepID=A0A934SU72_9BURK|nr:antitoxin Xre/MbcA/ParS toxin-binding domain-containing protein [Noviherbaspirillum pedocola]MBK4735530.1 DUF2384 domain-containing protein [Noviherbaspirillum pedocola]
MNTSDDEFDVPADFPQRSIGSGLAGAQPKLSVTKFQGRFYMLGNTPPERHARYHWCRDLAEQFVEAARTTRKGKRKDMHEADILLQYHDRVLAAGWGLEKAEAGWIFRHVAVVLNWPVPEAILPSTQELRTLAKDVLGPHHEAWWDAPSVWLDHQRPCELAQTVAGRRQVWEYLKRVETGTYT